MCLTLIFQWIAWMSSLIFHLNLWFVKFLIAELLWFLQVVMYLLFHPCFDDFGLPRNYSIRTIMLCLSIGFLIIGLWDLLQMISTEGVLEFVVHSAANFLAGQSGSFWSAFHRWLSNFELLANISHTCQSIFSPLTCDDFWVPLWSNHNPEHNQVHPPLLDI